MNRDMPAWYRRLWIKWAVTQFASIFCLATSAMYLFAGISRAHGETSTLIAAAFVVQMGLFYVLHWRLQGRATNLDPVRSDRIVALVKFRQSRFDPEF